ncbi:MAG TPA: M23 family metallopeptidase [Gemmatimonadaceae bacterium]
MTPPLAPAPGASVLRGIADEATAPIAALASAPAALAETVGSVPQRFLHPTFVREEPITVEPVVVEASTTSKIDTLTVSGVIHSSLFSSLASAADARLPKSARAELAFSLADIYEYRVDMSKDLQEGDKFHILVERLQKPNGAILINKILGARLALSGNDIEAILFESPHNSGEYFDAGGKSLKAAFLRAPVAFRRISSVFGGRRHPVLGIWRRHKGTDYAAAMGTPVRTIGDGVVIFAGRKGGYGNVIDIRHRNGFVSRYGHLRGFARGIRRGTHVGIGSTIGYVGMTGLATGPHLHFEVLVGGVQRDPRIALNMKGGQPIPSSDRQLFQMLRTRTLATIGLPIAPSDSN